MRPYYCPELNTIEDYIKKVDAYIDGLIDGINAKQLHKQVFQTGGLVFDPSKTIKGISDLRNYSGEDFTGATDGDR